VLRAMSSVAIMAMGLTLVIVVGEIDLSFGAMYGLAANTLAVVWIVMGVPVYLAIPSPSASAGSSACSTG
jgi:ribose/xylose/arabinose/galactoside ABC-type transport system permease subunit